MDAIQAISPKNKPVPAAPGATANDEGVANAFAALLGIVGSNFKGETTLGMDTKFMRSDDAAAARADEARDAAKVRDDKSEDRAAAKPKESKSRDDDQDESDTDATQTASDDDAAQDTTAAQPSQAAQDQAAAAAAAIIALDVPVVTSEVLAPVLIAQQVAAPVETVVAQQAVVETAAVVAEVAAVDTGVVKTAATDAATPEVATVEAPAAVTKTAENAGPAFKQVVAEVAAPVKTATVEETAKAATVVSEDANAAKAKDTQTNIQTQRSAAANAQSQDLSNKVGPETKAQVHVTVTGPAHAQAAATTSVYDIYSGYNNSQSTTANGQAGATDATNALVQNSKTPVEAAQAQVAASPSPALAPQTQGPQQGATSSAARADIAAPAPTQTGAGSQSNAGSNGAAFGNTGTQSGSAAGATTQTAPAERPLATAQQVIDQIKVNITRAAKAGLDKLTIRLKPVELGRVDVQLEMSEDHKVRVTVTADNKDTLALLQGDSRTLQQALNDAGLRTDSNNLHFSLRSESDAQNAGDGKAGGKNADATDNGADDESDDIAMTYDYTEAARMRGGVDTFA